MNVSATSHQWKEGENSISGGLDAVVLCKRRMVFSVAEVDIPLPLGSSRALGLETTHLEILNQRRVVTSACAPENSVAGRVFILPNGLESLFISIGQVVVKDSVASR